MRVKLWTAAALVLALSASSQAAAPARDRSVVREFSDTSAVGTSSLIRHADSVQMALHTTGLPPGHVVTVWWIVFNHPEFCQFGEPAVAATGFAGTKCGAGDLGIVSGEEADPRVDPAVVYAGGHLIGGDGIGSYAASLATGTPKTQLLLGTGLTNPQGADIHLVVHGHDAAAGDGHIGDEVRSFGASAGSDLQFTAHEAM
jgi:hypothetical protein